MTTKAQNDNGLLEIFKAEYVRKLSKEFLNRAVRGDLQYVTVDSSKLDQALIKTLEITKQTYPDFQIPPYGVWRLFEAGGVDRWSALASAREFQTADELLTAASDLAILAVYMDVSTPPGWSYEDTMAGTVATGRQATALAAINMFAAGSFSSDPVDPFRVDADALIRLETEELASGLQWNAGRDAALLKKLQRHLKRFGEALALRADLFGEGETTRPGNLLVKLGSEGWGSVDATAILDRLLQSLAPLWEGGAAKGDVSFGDSFEFSGESGQDGPRTIPFHLTAQVMVYSLVEPLAWAGYEVDELDTLTGPADAEHAALFVEAGVLRITSDEADLTSEQANDRMIELRAITGALIDQLADMLRKELEVEAEQLPLSCILEGGTNRAGAEILRENGALREKLAKFLNPSTIFWLPFGA
ncbi:DUF1688 family protein [Labrenzia sp. PHM005]|uniref:DUF1688 family protein n=1 Tax=Labrenzia sp. PHM005 TaxID=2590016 RepID=UPI00113FD453|nr:DUF1688 family protein [Labrenzia sp. PHM005]QDG74505.1 DUF1688 family protein [Labrenzia sp. PHM005]